MHIVYVALAALLTHASVSAETIKFHRTSVDPQTDKVIVTVQLDPEQAIVENSLGFTINSPDLSVGSWESDKSPVSYFDKKLKETKNGYLGSVTFTVVVNHESADLSKAADLFMHYLLNTQRNPQEKRFPLTTAPNTDPSDDDEVVNDPLAATSKNISAPPSSEETGLVARFKKIVAQIGQFFKQSKERLMTLVTTTESRMTQFLFALILGIFMSLTPCIYPMIPITVGILGTSTQNTLFHNFLLAFSYSCGMATTFALLGLLAATCGTQCGQIMSNPWFVIVLVALLAYLGFATLGWYEMWIPRFMQPSNKNVKRGSFISAFLFGMASGSIASPCMSPGLALILTIVAGLGNLFLGFLLLFMFGIGASAPLLIIGTFSASLHVLPKAGMWMIEFKKVFGFLLLGMCFYYLKNILPLTATYASSALFFMLVAGYYASRIAHYTTTFGKFVAFILSVMLFTTAGYLGYKAYASYRGLEVKSAHDWREDFAQAQEDARRENKLMLLDFGASWCSACNQLEKVLLHKAELEPLFDKVIAVRVDGSKQGAEPYNTLVKTYKLRGIPAIILTDAQGAVVKQWGGELVDRTPAEFVEMVQSYIK